MGKFEGCNNELPKYIVLLWKRWGYQLLLSVMFYKFSFMQNINKLFFTSDIWPRNMAKRWYCVQIYCPYWCSVQSVMFNKCSFTQNTDTIFMMSENWVRNWAEDSLSKCSNAVTFMMFNAPFLMFSKTWTYFKIWTPFLCQILRHRIQVQWWYIVKLLKYMYCLSHEEVNFPFFSHPIMFCIMLNVSTYTKHFCYVFCV